ALLKGLEKRGYSVRVKDEPGHPTVVKVLGETIPLWIEEKVRQKERVLTRAQAQEQKEHPFRYGHWDYQPSRRLSLRIKPDVYRSIRSQWTDGEKGNQRVESMLDKFVEGVIVAAEAIKHRREEDRLRELRRAEEQRKVAEESRRRYEEAERRKAL